jgi:Tol biopolymer transport system component
MKAPTLALALLILSSAATAQAPATGTLGFYRSPTISGETIVFAAEGDIWSVPSTGGLARRLTSHAAEESSPVISPDGRTLAFTGRYEGPAALYTMPLTGGTRCNAPAMAMPQIPTWTPDGKLVAHIELHGSRRRRWSARPSERNAQSRALAGASKDRQTQPGALCTSRGRVSTTHHRRYTSGTARN